MLLFQPCPGSCNVGVAKYSIKLDSVCNGGSRATSFNTDAHLSGFHCIMLLSKLSLKLCDSIHVLYFPHADLLKIPKRTNKNILSLSNKQTNRSILLILICHSFVFHVSTVSSSCLYSLYLHLSPFLYSCECAVF